MSKDTSHIISRLALLFSFSIAIGAAFHSAAAAVIAFTGVNLVAALIRD